VTCDPDRLRDVIAAQLGGGKRRARSWARNNIYDWAVDVVTDSRRLAV
jgi:hypothetical protein